MLIRCIRDFSQYKPGDTEEVPDGAAFDPFHWEPVISPELAAAFAADEAAADAESDLAALQDHLTEPRAKQAAPVQFPANAPKEM